MRQTARSTTVAALAAAALLAGTDVAGAQETDPVGPTDPDTTAECVHIPVFTGTTRCMSLDPELAAQLGSLGYGSLGTGSLLDLVTRLISTGSTVLSVDIPNSTGSYAPGSFGSYGPEASIGQLSSTLTGSFGQGA